MEREVVVGNLPPSARIVRAYGNVATESLMDEYDASPERQAAFVRELISLDETERDSILEDSDVLL